MTSNDEGSEEGVSNEGTPKPALVKSGEIFAEKDEVEEEEPKEIFITMSLVTAEKLRHFLQEHNIGQTDIADVYHVLLSVTEKLGITGRYPYGMQYMSPDEAVFSSPFFQKMKAGHEAKKKEEGE